MDGIIRRREMVEVSHADTPTNPLVNGNYQGTTGSKGDIKVTLGYHVYCYKRWGDGTWGYHVPFTNEFTINPGDVIEVKANLIERTTNAIALALRSSTANVLTIGSLSTLGENTYTVTATNTAQVAYIHASCSGSAKSKHTIEYQMWVNGVRFI